jgi:hypothetical protein
VRSRGVQPLRLYLTCSAVTSAAVDQLQKEHREFQVRFFCDRVKARLYGPPEELAKMLKELPQEVFSDLSTAMFVLLPIFALAAPPGAPSSRSPSRPYSTGTLSTDTLGRVVAWK